MTPAKRRIIEISYNNKGPLKCCISWFLFQGGLACYNVVAQKEMVKSLENQFETLHKKSMFWTATCTIDLDLVQYKEVGGKMILLSNHQCPVSKLNIHAPNIPKIFPKHLQNLLRMSLKYACNALWMAKNSLSPRWSPWYFGDVS